MEGRAVIAVCVGHSRPGDRGAVSLDGTREWTYCGDLAERISALLDAAGLEHQVISRYQGRGYGSAMTWLARELKAAGAVLAVELHFNWASTRAASGHEWLHAGSTRGRMLAGCLQAAMKAAFPAALPRGLKVRTAAENGGGFLHRTHCPACVAEPFFGTNPDDWEHIAGNPLRLASALANGLATARARL